MEKGHLLFKLKQFYVLESYQLDLYRSQLKSIEEPHIKRAYELLVNRETQHVDYYAKTLKEYGSRPPLVLGPAFVAAGFVTGKALDLMGLKERYQIGIAVENKAVDMYQEFIQMASDDPRLTDLTKQLWYQMIDEEFHQYWFKEQLSRLGNNDA